MTIICDNGTNREMNDDELIEYKEFLKGSEIELKRMAALESIKVDARAKLIALGLTDDEINAIARN